jgi:hypothetical protein
MLRRLRRVRTSTWIMMGIFAVALWAYLLFRPGPTTTDSPLGTQSARTSSPTVAPTVSPRPSPTPTPRATHASPSPTVGSTPHATVGATPSPTPTGSPDPTATDPTPPAG